MDFHIFIRRFRESDADAVSQMIVETIQMTNSKDYPTEYLKQVTAHLQPEDIRERSRWQHFYVAQSEGQIIGCGAIGPYWGKLDESSLFTIFVRPDFQRQNIGRKIVEYLEKDEFFLRAKRIEIPASVTGVRFYLKMGYDYKNGITEPDDEGLIRLEKRRTIL